MYVYLSNILLRFLNLQLKKHQKFPVTIFLDFRELQYTCSTLQNIANEICFILFLCSQKFVLRIEQKTNNMFPLYTCIPYLLFKAFTCDKWLFVDAFPQFMLL